VAGFWRRIELWAAGLQHDRERAARVFRIAYWISWIFVLVGVLVIALDLTGAWKPSP
jgi:hypothetical protein